MKNFFDILIASFLFLPLLGACVLPFASRAHRGLVCILVSIINLILLVLGVIAAYELSSGQGKLIEVFKVKVYIDSLTTFMMIVISMVSMAVGIYANSYMDHYHGKTKFYVLFLLMIGGMHSFTLAPDLFTLYVFLEVSAITSYILVGFSLEWDGIEAAFKYIVLSVISTTMVLVACAFLFAQYGTLNIRELSVHFSKSPLNILSALTGGLLLCGFSFKAALIPFHAWLPDAHPSAPSPVSAMLSGVLIKILGIYAVIRILFGLYGGNSHLLEVLIVLGVISMVLGVILAYKQDDFKRLLAYSSISQIGYVALGIGLGTPLGIAGGLFHLLNHALFKALLFLNAGAVEYRLGTRRMKEMGGLENRMPVTTTTSLIASLSIVGIPPLNGFWSKLFIIVAAIEAKSYILATIAVAVSILTLATLMKVQSNVFFGKLNEKWSKVKEVPVAMSLGMIILAILCIAIGIGYPYVMDHFIEPAVKTILG